uniref:Transcriptional regulator n=1 Tax=Echinostoma caproni TaxID=27848 RepID=A0A183A4K3_9TREM
LINQLQRLDKDRVSESERAEGVSLVSRKVRIDSFESEFIFYIYEYVFKSVSDF